MVFAITPSLLLDIGLIIILATLLAYLAKGFRQPLIPAYIIGGLILGPVGFGVIRDPELIKGLSEIGIAFLLFIVGLEINLAKLKDVGMVSTVGGSIQVLVTFFFGFGAAIMLGFNMFDAFILGLVLAFSSTMVVIKLLSDKEELTTLHGKIIVGFLLMQDILIILALSMMKNVAGFSILIFLIILLKGVLLVGFAALLNKFLIARIFRFAAKSQELLFLSSITVCFIFSLMAHSLDFSIAVGAFIGGVTLANLPYHYDIIARIRPLKDFFATIFFVSLGMQIILVGTKNIIIPIIVFLAIIIILKPVIILALVNLFGYGKRASFISGISLAQISEFSLILVILVQDSISTEVFSTTIILAIITIAVTSYLIKYDEKIYNKVAKYLEFFEKFPIKYKKLSYKEKTKPKVLLFGCHRMGGIILKTFSKIKKDILVIDFNPEVINRLIDKKIPCLYGDVANLEILQRVNFKEAKIAISSIPHEEDNQILLEYAKRVNPKILVFLTANHLHEALNLYETGADYVILPPVVSGERISHFLQKTPFDKKSISALRKKHLKHLLELNSEK